MSQKPKEKEEIDPFVLSISLKEYYERLQVGERLTRHKRTNNADSQTPVSQKSDANNPLKRPAQKNLSAAPSKKVKKFKNSSPISTSHLHLPSPPPSLLPPPSPIPSVPPSLSLPLPSSFPLPLDPSEPSSAKPRKLLPDFSNEASEKKIKSDFNLSSKIKAELPFRIKNESPKNQVDKGTLRKALTSEGGKKAGLQLLSRKIKKDKIGENLKESQIKKISQFTERLDGEGGAQSGGKNEKFIHGNIEVIVGKFQEKTKNQEASASKGGEKLSQIKVMEGSGSNKLMEKNILAKTSENNPKSFENIKPTQKKKKKHNDVVLKQEEVVFPDFIAPFQDELDEGELKPKLMSLLKPQHFLNAIIKKVSVQENVLKITTSNIKIKGNQKGKNIIGLTNGTQVDLDQDPILIVQEPCLIRIKSFEKLTQLLDDECLSHFDQFLIKKEEALFDQNDNRKELSKDPPESNIKREEFQIENKEIQLKNEEVQIKNEESKMNDEEYQSKNEKFQGKTVEVKNEEFPLKNEEFQMKMEETQANIHKPINLQKSPTRNETSIAALESSIKDEAAFPYNPCHPPNTQDILSQNIFVPELSEKIVQETLNPSENNKLNLKDQIPFERNDANLKSEDQAEYDGLILKNQPQAPITNVPQFEKKKVYLKNEVLNEEFFWPVFVLQNFGKKNAMELVAGWKGEIKDDEYLSLEVEKDKEALKFDRKPKMGEEPSKSCLIYYFGTNYYETVDYSEIIRFSKGSRRREEGVERRREEERKRVEEEKKRKEEEGQIKKEEEWEKKREEEGGRRKEDEEGRRREEEVDLSQIKKFFYGNQFLKALFSDYIGKIKEFNIPMERNSQFVITYKTRNYQSRLVKLVKKGDGDGGITLYGILLNSKTTENNKSYIYIQRLDNLQLSWVSLSEDSYQITTSLNYPPIPRSSYPPYSLLASSSIPPSSISPSSLLPPSSPSLSLYPTSQLFNFFNQDYPISAYSEVIGQYEPRSPTLDLSQSNREKDRCPKCNYILGNLEIWGCLDCKKMFHRQCAEGLEEGLKKKESGGRREEGGGREEGGRREGGREEGGRKEGGGKKEEGGRREMLDWVCYDCKFCLICNYKQKDLEQCEKCGSFFHKECIGGNLERKEEGGKRVEEVGKKDEGSKKAEELIGIKKEEGVGGREDGGGKKEEGRKEEGVRREEGCVCPKCSICSCCGKQKELVSGTDDKQICESCSQIQASMEFCKVCAKPWIKTSKTENKKHAKHWIFCNVCSGWVHRLCDSLLGEDKVFGWLQSSNLEYFCPVCRVERKKKELADFVGVLADLDQNKYFYLPVDADKVPYYRAVVLDPMDFSTMISKCQAGIYLPSPFQLMHTDFELICNNAILFNFRTSHIHLEAKKLKLFGNYAFSFFSHHLQLPSNDYITPQVSIKSLQKGFSEKIGLFYYDILFSEEPGNNCTTIVQRGEKELYIEVNSVNDFYIKALPASSECQGSSSMHMGESHSSLSPPPPPSSIESLIEEEEERGRGEEEGRREERSREEGKRREEEGRREERRREEEGGRKREEEGWRRREEEGLREKSLREALREMMSQNFMHPFFSFEPIPLNFSMKNLLEAEACLICGSFDSEEDLWICDECHDGFHYYCLYPKDIDVRKSIRMEEDLPWHCPRCCICLKCGGKTNEGSLITCLDCKKTYHIRCVGEKNCGLYWKCEECFKCEICESKTMFNKNDEPIRYELCENYSKCYQCSVLEAFFHFCRYCKKYISTAHSPIDSVSLSYLSFYEPYLSCTQCNFLFHSNCLPPTAHAPYVCSECELISESRLAEEGQKQQELLLKLADLKRKQEETRFNIELIKIILESCPLSILPHKPDLDLQNQLLLKDFVLYHKSYFNGEDFSLFKKNLPILASIDELPKNKKLRTKIVSTLTENMEVEHSLRFLFEFEKFDHLFCQAVWGEGIRSQVRIRIVPKNLGVEFGKGHGGGRREDGGCLIPMRVFEFLERFSILPRSIRFEEEGWGLNARMGCFFGGKSLFNAGLFLPIQTFPIEDLYDIQIEEKLTDSCELDRELKKSEKYLLGLKSTLFINIFNEIDVLIEKNEKKGVLIDVEGRESRVFGKEEKDIDETTLMFKRYLKFENKVKSDVVEMFINFERKPKLSVQVKLESKMEIEKKPNQKKHKILQISNPNSFELEPSALDDVPCEFCRLAGKRKILGRLLSFDLDRYVHSSCALWSFEVHENLEGELLKFPLALKRSQSTNCVYCGFLGASLVCLRSKNGRSCSQKFHLSCGLKEGCVFLRDKNVVCVKCKEAGEVEVREENIVREFNTRRRLFIREIFNSKPNLKNIFTRLGAFILLHVSKSEESEENMMIFDEFFILRKIFDKQNQRIFLLLSFISKANSFLGSLKSFKDVQSLPDLNEDYFSSNSRLLLSDTNKIEDLQSLYTLLSPFLKTPLLSLSLLYFSHFLGLSFSPVQRLIKETSESNWTFKKQSSITQALYSEDLEKMNIFKRQRKIAEYFDSMDSSSELTRPVKSAPKANPKRGILKKSQKENILENHRKIKDIAEALKVEEIVGEGRMIGTEIDEVAEEGGEEIGRRIRGEYGGYLARKRKGVFVGPSKIHKYGLFAMENIKKYEIVIEYVGELIRNEVADLREEDYKIRGFGDCYMFRVDKEFVIDATFHGNQARYLNHSCDHNCGSYIYERKIIIYASKDIHRGEEITYDYQFDLEAEKLKCTCGAKNCQGRLN